MTVFVDGTVAEVAVQTRAAGLRENMFEPVFQGTSRIIYAAGIAAWAAAMLYFWAWWLQPEHIIDLPYFLLLTATVGWVTIIPAYFILIFFNACRVRSDRPMATPGRIAMVVTKAPSEPFAVVRRTLLAMLDQIDYEFDVWLADEDPSAETIDWCAQRGIRISTRKGGSISTRSAGSTCRAMPTSTSAGRRPSSPTSPRASPPGALRASASMPNCSVPARRARRASPPRRSGRRMRLPGRGARGRWCRSPAAD